VQIFLADLLYEFHIAGLFCFQPGSVVLTPLFIFFYGNVYGNVPLCIIYLAFFSYQNLGLLICWSLFILAKNVYN